ncbi:unnamed protein product [Effrenium voratum]|nr:unnamed protein product [Effrenium voratum]
MMRSPRARSKLAAGGLAAVAIWMAGAGWRQSVAFLPGQANSRRELLASAMLLSFPTRANAERLGAKNRISSLSLENDVESGNFDGYDMEGTMSRLGDKLSAGYEKVKPVCEEVSIIANGGSRTSLDDSTKRYVCDRNDLQKQKEEKGEYSYINAAKDVKAEERAQKQAECILYSLWLDRLDHDAWMYF